MKSFLNKTIALALVGTLASCSKILDVKPDGVLLINEALQTPEDFEKVLNSCYDVAANYYNGRIQALGEVLGDNLAEPVNNADLLEVYRRRTNVFNGTSNGVYREPYRSIFRINFLIENFDMVDVPAARRNSMEAECRFLRALGHFELVRLWGLPFRPSSAESDLGIVIQEENSGTTLKARNTVAETYRSIIRDLEFAEANLPDANGVYADKMAAKAALAKVYFQMNNLEKAADYAGEVIASNRYQLGDLDRFIMGEHPEAIFATRSTAVANTIDNRSGAFTGNYRSDISDNPTLRITRAFYDELVANGEVDSLRLGFFEVRNTNLDNEFVAVTKFNKNQFNVPVLHLTDMMLIRAECLAQLNTNLPEAKALINAIAERAYGDNSRNMTIEEAIDVRNFIRYQRRIELFGEGDRVHELKRRGARGENIQVRNAPWDCPGMTLQFPAVEESDVFIMNQEGGCN